MLDKKITELYNEIGNIYRDIAAQNGKYKLYYFKGKIISGMNNRLYKEDCTELITDYPFFRDGMTLEQFEKEQRLYAKYLNNGGEPKAYKPSFEK